MTNKINQNIYDDPDFFSGYKQLRQNKEGFNDLIEQPAIHTLLPSLKNKKILDIGCGFGHFARYARANDAANVIAIDPSKNMINEAIKLTHDDQIIYKNVGIENAEENANYFDLIVSSLAFHYVENFQSLIEKISHWLKADGYLIFSVEHPICTAYPEATIKTDEHGRDFHPIYNYRDEGVFYQHWFVEGVQKYHRHFSTYVNTLLENNFHIEKILEPMPDDKYILQHPQFAIHKIRPPLLIIKARIAKDLG